MREHTLKTTKEMLPFFFLLNIFISNAALLNSSNLQMTVEENSGISFSGNVLFSRMSFDVIQCFCNDSALYQMHLYGPGKMLPQRKWCSSTQIGWGKYKSARVWQSYQLSNEML